MPSCREPVDILGLCFFGKALAALSWRPVLISCKSYCVGSYKTKGVILTQYIVSSFYNASYNCCFLVRKANSVLVLGLNLFN